MASLNKNKRLLKNKTENQESIYSNTIITSESLRLTFKHNSDIKFSESYYKNNKITLIYCSGLINQEILFDIIPNSLERFFSSLEGELSKELILNELNLPSLDIIYKKEEAISSIFAGKLLLDFSLTGVIFTVDIAKRPQRSPEDTKTETTVKGPRDDFIEDIDVNISLIRKRLRTTSFVFDEYVVGKRSQSKVAVLYMKDIANKKVYEQLKQKLTSINTEALFSGTQLEELITGRKYPLFPRHRYTGKPDFAAQCLLAGRFVILIDGAATAFITPINFFLLLKGSEDKENAFIYSSFERLLRILGLLICVALPGFWLALITFHQDQIPISLLASEIQSRKGVPVPSWIEAILMLLLFDLFKEAGLRLPTAIGQVLSVVGGLIIGQAAIEAGFSSTTMLVIVATSTIATFTLFDQSLIGTLSIIRFLCIFLSTILGFTGLFFALCFTCVYAININTFGVPYFEVNEKNWIDVMRMFLRIPFKTDKKRTTMTNEDSTRQGD